MVEELNRLGDRTNLTWQSGSRHSYDSFLPPPCVRCLGVVRGVQEMGLSLLWHQFLFSCSVLLVRQPREGATRICTVFYSPWYLAP